MKGEGVVYMYLVSTLYNQKNYQFYYHSLSARNSANVLIYIENFITETHKSFTMSPFLLKVSNKARSEYPIHVLYISILNPEFMMWKHLTRYSVHDHVLMINLFSVNRVI